MEEQVYWVVEEGEEGIDPENVGTIYEALLCSMDQCEQTFDTDLFSNAIAGSYGEKLKKKASALYDELVVAKRDSVSGKICDYILSR